MGKYMECTTNDRSLYVHTCMYLHSYIIMDNFLNLLDHQIDLHNKLLKKGNELFKKIHVSHITTHFGKKCTEFSLYHRLHAHVIPQVLFVWYEHSDSAAKQLHLSTTRCPPPKRILQQQSKWTTFLIDSFSWFSFCVCATFIIYLPMIFLLEICK